MLACQWKLSGVRPRCRFRRNCPSGVEDVWTDLTVPRTVEPRIRRADRKAALALLPNTSPQADTDRHGGENLACRIVQRSKSADDVRVTFSDDGDIDPENPHQRTQETVMTRGEMCVPLAQQC